jgi:hypothetical protein
MEIRSLVEDWRLWGREDRQWEQIERGKSTNRLLFGEMRYSSLGGLRFLLRRVVRSSIMSSKLGKDVNVDKTCKTVIEYRAPSLTLLY